MELHLFCINLNKPMIYQSSLIFRWTDTLAVWNNECIHKEKKVSQIKYPSKFKKLSKNLNWFQLLAPMLSVST